MALWRFCGRPDIGAKLLLLSWQHIRIRRGARLPQKSGAAEALALL
ncbi:hypothetical protein L686_05715 [Stutzerimonas stutzeri MF28]|nr:hypothetical protein L686_05715 [Stutzerimonas stutzeri MF28]